MPTLFFCVPRLLLVFRQLQQYFLPVRFSLGYQGRDNTLPAWQRAANGGIVGLVHHTARPRDHHNAASVSGCGVYAPLALLPGPLSPVVVSCVLQLTDRATFPPFKNYAFTQIVDLALNFVRLHFAEPDFASPITLSQDKSCLGYQSDSDRPTACGPAVDRPIGFVKDANLPPPVKPSHVTIERQVPTTLSSGWLSVPSQHTSEPEVSVLQEVNRSL